MKTILTVLFLLCGSVSAHEMSDDAKIRLDWAMQDLVSLRDSLQEAWDSGNDPAEVEFPSGAVRKINRSVLKSPRDAQYYAHPDKFPPVGYIALIDYRIAKLQAKIDKNP